MTQDIPKQRLDLARVRPSIQKFAIEMESQMQDRGFTEPGWWNNVDPAFLFVSLLNETDELQSLFSLDQCNTCAESRNNCYKCLAPKPDGCNEKTLGVALLCFMLWDQKEVM